MTDYSDEFRAYAVHLTAEHRRLAECLRQIEQRLQQISDDPIGSIAGLVESLERLRAELSTHFDEEEAGGCLEEAIAHLPRLAADADRVLNEHPQLLVELARIIEQIKSPNGAQLGDIQRAFEQFAKHLLAHEAAENRILQESFGIDMP